MELRMYFGMDLHANKKFGDAICRFVIERFTGCRIRLMKADESEIPTFVMLRRLLLVAWIGSHAETDLAKSMGLPYTEGTMGLCEDYLSKFS